MSQRGHFKTDHGWFSYHAKALRVCRYDPLKVYNL